MLNEEIIEFCEYYAISIEKFLNENFSIEKYVPKFNERKKKWRVKHSEIAGWLNVIPVSLKFAFRYKHLVLTGKLVIVRDDYGKFNVYVNPRIIQESQELGVLHQKLRELEESPEMFDDAFKVVEFKQQLVEKIADLEENLRIIKHFHGDESLEYTSGIMNLIPEVKLSRKKN